MKKVLFWLALTLLTSCDLHKWDLDRDDFPTTEQVLNKSYNVVPQLDLKIDSLGRFNFAMNSGTRAYSCQLNLDVYEVGDTVINPRQMVRATWQDKRQQLFLYEGDSLQLPFITKRACKDKFILKYWELIDYFNKTVGKAESIQLFDMVVGNDDEIFACGQSRQSIGPRVPWAFVMKLSKTLQIEWVRPYLLNAKASHIIIDPMDGNLVMDGQSADGDFTFVAKMIPQKLGKLTLKKHTTLGGNRGHHVMCHLGKIYHTGIYKDPPYSPVIVQYDSGLQDLGFHVLKTVNCTNPLLATNRNNTIVVTYSETWNKIHLSEIEPNISTKTHIWCNRFEGNEEYQPLDLVQSPDFGYVIFLQNRTSGQLKIIKTDEEGATRTHPYIVNNPNCE